MFGSNLRRPRPLVKRLRSRGHLLARVVRHVGSSPVGRINYSRFKPRTSMAGSLPLVAVSRQLWLCLKTATLVHCEPGRSGRGCTLAGDAELLWRLASHVAPLRYPTVSTRSPMPFGDRRRMLPATQQLHAYNPSAYVLITVKELMKSNRKSSYDVGCLPYRGTFTLL